MLDKTHLFTQSVDDGDGMHPADTQACYADRPAAADPPAAEEPPAAEVPAPPGAPGGNGGNNNGNSANGGNNNSGNNSGNGGMAIGNNGNGAPGGILPTVWVAHCHDGSVMPLSICRIANSNLITCCCISFLRSSTRCHPRHNLDSMYCVEHVNELQIHT